MPWQWDSSDEAEKYNWRDDQGKILCETSDGSYAGEHEIFHVPFSKRRDGAKVLMTKEGRG